jgi:hypothetical protein
VDDSAMSEGESSDFPVPRVCNVVTSAIPIATMPPSGESLMLKTIPVVPQQTAIPRSDTRPLPEQPMAYHEEQRRALQDDIEREAT